MGGCGRWKRNRGVDECEAVFLCRENPQEVDGVEANNGICYRLHLLYHHGQSF